jgi:zinc protease
VSTSLRPSPAPPRPYHFPKFERVALENGLTLVVAPVHKLPLVSVMVVTDAGATAEPPGKAGVAQLTASALLEGSLEHSGEEIAERFELLGASVQATADWDSAALSMTVLASHLDEALALMGKVLLTPAFPAQEIDRLKTERLAELLQLRAEPRGLADEMFSRILYAAGSRYAEPEDGSTESVQSITGDDLSSFYASRYRPSGTALIMAGDITVEGAVSLARKIFGHWTGASPTPSRASTESARRTRAIHIVQKDDAPQSELRIGHVGLARSHPDFFPVLVMNNVLGGLFSSRINLNLREVHGYTYGAHSGFEWRREAGPFLVSSAVKSEVTAEAAREVVQEIERIRSEPITESELTLATSYMHGVFPIRYETTSALAHALAGMVVYGLDADYFDTYRSRVGAVTVEDVLRAAATHLHPGALQLLAVGDPSLIREPLERMQFAPVTVYDANGVPLGAAR